MARLLTAIAKVVALVPDSTDLQLMLFAHARTSTVADWGPFLRDPPTIVPELRRLCSRYSGNDREAT